MFYEKKKTMENEKNRTEESVVRELHETLNLDKAFPQEILDKARECVISTGKELGDPLAEEVLDNCLIELSQLSSHQTRGMVIIHLLSTLPVSTQRLIVKGHGVLLNGLLMKTMLEVDKKDKVRELLSYLMGTEDSNE